MKASSLTYAHDALINIGKCYTYLKEFKKAQLKFNEVFKHSKDSFVLGVSYLFAGINQFHAEQYDLACLYIRNSFKFPQIAAWKPFQTLYLAESYFKLSANDSAKIYAFKT